jgi:tRNA threonylcarbamoyladenosine biosynthesis protein TsaB
MSSSVNLLALDTTSDACSVAVLCGGEIKEQFVLTKNEHSKMLLTMVDELMAEAGITPTQLDAIAFGRGPGSFTGIRIGVGVVQGIAFAAELPVIPISSMAAIASGCENKEYIAVALDARMQQIYCACYQRATDGMMVLYGTEQVMNPDQWQLDRSISWHGAGSGWGVYADTLMQNNVDCVHQHHSDCYPRAKDIVRMGAVMFAAGEGRPAHEALPVYIRDDVAKKPK